MKKIIYVGLSLFMSHNVAFAAYGKSTLDLNAVKVSSKPLQKLERANGPKNRKPPSPKHRTAVVDINSQVVITQQKPKVPPKPKVPLKPSFNVTKSLAKPNIVASSDSRISIETRPEATNRRAPLRPDTFVNPNQRSQTLTKPTKVVPLTSETKPLKESVQKFSKKELNAGQKKGLLGKQKNSPTVKFLTQAGFLLKGQETVSFPVVEFAREFTWLQKGQLLTAESIGRFQENGGTVTELKQITNMLVKNKKLANKLNPEFVHVARLLYSKEAFMVTVPNNLDKRNLNTALREAIRVSPSNNKLQNLVGTKELSSSKLFTANSKGKKHSNNIIATQLKRQLDEGQPLVTREIADQLIDVFNQPDFQTAYIKVRNAPTVESKKLAIASFKDLYNQKMKPIIDDSTKKSLEQKTKLSILGDVGKLIVVNEGVENFNADYNDAITTIGRIFARNTQPRQETINPNDLFKVAKFSEDFGNVIEAILITSEDS